MSAVVQKQQFYSFECFVPGKFWTAPELLALSPGATSQKGDVYSFGVILQEIITRNESYGERNMEPSGTLSPLVCKIKSGSSHMDNHRSPHGERACIPVNANYKGGPWCLLKERYGKYP